MAFPTIDAYLFSDEDARKLPSPVAGGALVALPATFTMTTEMLASDKVSRVLRVPKGFTLYGIAASVPDMDSNGSAALVWDLGFPDDQNGIVAASTAGQAAGTLDNSDLASAGIGYKFTAETDILWTTTTASATAVAGEIKLALFGVID